MSAPRLAALAISRHLGMSAPRSLKVINKIKYLTFLSLGKAKGTETIVKVDVEKWSALKATELTKSMF